MTNIILHEKCYFTGEIFSRTNNMSTERYCYAQRGRYRINNVAKYEFDIIIIIYRNNDVRTSL